MRLLYVEDNEKLVQNICASLRKNLLDLRATSKIQTLRHIGYILEEDEQ